MSNYFNGNNNSIKFCFSSKSASSLSGQEVGDARNDADGRFRANLRQRVTESLEMAAGQHLGRLDRGVGAATGLVHVVADVGVADQGEDTKLSHLEAGSEV